MLSHKSAVILGLASIFTISTKVLAFEYFKKQIITDLLKCFFYKYKIFHL